MLKVDHTVKDGKSENQASQTINSLPKILFDVSLMRCNSAVWCHD